MNTLIILGSGTSTGIPMANGDWGKCDPQNPKNSRLRTSIFLKTKNGSHIIVDTGPDMRTQCLKNNIEKINAAIITHDHADHLHGLDDLRPFCFGPPLKSIPLYTSKTSYELLETRFPYVFNPRPNASQIGGGIPLLELKSVELDKKTKVDQDDFEFFQLPHGPGQTMGIIHEKMAYIIDCHEIPKDRLEYLAKAKLEILLLDCVTNAPHKTHLWLERSLEYAHKIKAKNTYLIHMGNKLDHKELETVCKEQAPLSVTPAFDGLTLSY